MTDEQDQPDPELERLLDEEAAINLHEVAADERESWEAAMALIGAALHLQVTLGDEPGQAELAKAVPGAEAFESLLTSNTREIAMARLIIRHMAQVVAGVMDDTAELHGIDPVAAFQNVALREAAEGDQF